MDDIAFYPADPTMATTLTAGQVRAFNEDGFISPIDALTAEEAEQSREYFDFLLAELARGNDRRNAYSIMGYQTRCKGIWDLAMHPRILACVEDLIGPDFVCWTSHYFCKMPEDKKRVPWHQDATYWPVRPTQTVTVWLAIDNVDSGNAPMRFLPGSHDLGKIPWEQAQGDVVLGQEIADVSAYRAPFENVLRAGQMSIHASTLIHGSDPNASTRRRCGLTLRYVPSSCGVTAGAERVLQEAIPSRGNPGAWHANARPDGDDLAPIHKHYRD